MKVEPFHGGQPDLVPSPGLCVGDQGEGVVDGVLHGRGAEDFPGPGKAVAVDVDEGFVYAGERSTNRVRRVPIAGGTSEVFIDSLNSNIGMTIIPSSPTLA